MEECVMEKSVVKRSRRKTGKLIPPALSVFELAKLGDGRVAYIKAMTSDEARRMFPSIEGLPDDMGLFALHGADGTPIALTDSLTAAVGHAVGDELEVASVH
jgi:hypothetical protein